MIRNALLSRGTFVAALGFGVLGILPATSASSQTLEQALSQAYKANPTIAAQRARLRALDEAVPQALAGYRPTAKLAAEVSRQAGLDHYDGAIAKDKTEGTQKTLSVSISQPLFDATVTPSVRKAEKLVQAQRATLLATEGTVLLNAATAYLDVVKYEAVVELDKNNEQVLKRQLEASRHRFRIGEYTRTDVALSESSLASAMATRIQAEGQFAASQGTYQRYIRSKPGKLASPKPVIALPKTLDDVIALAEANNPNIIAAAYSEAAQRDAIDQSFGSLLPSAVVATTAARSWDLPHSTGDAIEKSSDSLTITGKVIVPLYQAGLPEAKLRETKHTASQYRLQTADTRNQVKESAISAWQSLETARANVVSYKAQIEAAGVALDGVRQEAQVGSRTVLDVLSSQQDLLSARVNLVNAERNERVAAFTVLSVIGQLSAKQLGLKVDYYDPSANYQNTRNKWIGTSVDE